MASSPSAGSNKTRAAIALGSNLGDRRGHLAWAADQLAALLSDIRVSSVIETDPVGVADTQPPYLNAALVGDTTLPAGDLLDRLLALERVRGRERPALRAPRTLDLDLILFGDTITADPGLELPHPRFRERWFVLGPLAEVAPDMRDPVSGLTIAELASKLRVD